MEKSVPCIICGNPKTKSPYPYCSNKCKQQDHKEYNEKFIYLQQLKLSAFPKFYYLVKSLENDRKEFLEKRRKIILERFKEKINKRFKENLNNFLGELRK